MLGMVWKPTLYSFDTCKRFTEAFRLNRDDLIFDNAYIYEPYFGCIENLNCHVTFREKYGAREPTDATMGAIPADAAKTSCKRVTAIGGGTVIDIAKVLAISDGGGMDDLYDKAPNLEGGRELIIIPTTRGTGSKVANISIIVRARIGTKLSLVNPTIYTDYAVLISQLLEGLPFKVLVASSIGTLVHAMGSALPPEATPYTKLFDYKAVEMITQGYQTIAKKRPESRFLLLNDLLLASNYAGLAFGTVGCAAAHATSYPLGGKYHMAHDKSNYVMFTGVLKNYMEFRQGGEIAVLNQYLVDLLGYVTGVVYDELEELLDQIPLKQPPREYGVTREDLPVFTHSVVTERDHLMTSNLVPLDEARVLKTYQELF